MSNFFCKYQSPLDEITIVSNGSAITGLWFTRQKHFDAKLGENTANSDLPIFAKAIRWLDAYFAGKNPGEIPPIQLDGTPFQLEVWRILQTIPYGERTTYGEIAKNIAKKRGIAKMSARAVGGAVGRNPISIFVPCHRVVGSNGKLTGYAGGIEKKIKLLKLENIL